MRNMLRFGIIALGICALSGMAGAATAAFGTFSFANLGSITFTDTPAGNTIGDTTIQVHLPTQQINGLDPTYLGNTNSFCNTTDCTTAGPDPNGELFIGNTLAFLSGSNTINISGGLASLVDFQFASSTTPANRYEFLAGGSGIVTTTISGTSHFLTITYTGNFTDSAGFFDSQQAVVSFTFTQSSPGSTVSEAGSFSSPAVPEPASMVLIGGGLVGISLLARKKRKA